ncbi:nuclear transport factor 2 family protein [Herbaspirillum sp. LeCh32-8]|uniref:nuclear transport factor 2 family protein n=1 Tax=Herbaspirillum sp. LeCh32-8 TaxID=2821356 RepID=UPI001AE80FDB|nr:nuclear transport factor 2 family protein [Herbaspirillum sp. LeCh32-8]MBP0596778.1 nuclear transport factor 2 family protein [Herbaspirillum sp. LeCh32-8]
MTTQHQQSPAADHSSHVSELVRFFETLTQDNAAQVAAIYAADARFKDPFNEVQGLEAIQHLFAHMFKQVKDPRFKITATVAQGEQVFLTWDFFFRMPPFSAGEQCIRGATHFHLAEDGRVLYHRDYWDAAEELYEKLPLVGLFMRGLKCVARQ